MIKMCYWKIISESPSREGEVFRNQHPEIKFDKCRSYCRGYRNGNHCEHYEIRDISDELVEMLNDSWE